MALIAGHYRCSICNCTNNAEIATNPEDYKHTLFVEDPSNPSHVICLECKEAVDEVNGEWLDFNDNEIDWDNPDWLYNEEE